MRVIPYIVAWQTAGLPSGHSQPSRARRRFDKSCRRERDARHQGARDCRELPQLGHLRTPSGRTRCRVRSRLAARKRPGGGHPGQSGVHLFVPARLGGRILDRLCLRAARPHFAGRARGWLAVCASFIASCFFAPRFASSSRPRGGPTLQRVNWYCPRSAPRQGFAALGPPPTGERLVGVTVPILQPVAFGRPEFSGLVPSPS
jgi:hypothetical protein